MHELAHFSACATLTLFFRAIFWKETFFPKPFYYEIFEVIKHGFTNHYVFRRLTLKHKTKLLKIKPENFQNLEGADMIEFREKSILQIIKKKSLKIFVKKENA